MAEELIKSDATIKAKKPEAAPYRLSDGDGLYLLVRPDGKRWWRLDYTHAGKRKTLSLGTYPDTGLALARRKAAAEREIGEAEQPGLKRRVVEIAELEMSAPHPVIGLVGDGSDAENVDQFDGEEGQRNRLQQAQMLHLGYRSSGGPRFRCS